MHTARFSVIEIKKYQSFSLRIYKNSDFQGVPFEQDEKIEYKSTDLVY